MGDAGAGDSGDAGTTGENEAAAIAVAVEGLDMGGGPADVGASPDAGDGEGAGTVPPPTVAAASAAAEPTKPSGTVPSKQRKQRRRSLLSEEEGGLLSQAPTYRRSLLGY